MTVSALVDHRAIVRAWEAQRDAMVSADTSALDALLAEDFALTHMTGYLQPKAEWLADIDTDQMQYHSMEDVDVAVTVEDGIAILIAHTMTEATIWGGHGTWRLALRITYEHVDDAWLAKHSLASIW
jgi:hypothetical protein